MIDVWQMLVAYFVFTRFVWAIGRLVLHVQRRAWVLPERERLPE